MKMKLAQKLLLAYYKTKLRTIAIVSPKRAAEIALTLFSTPRKAKTPLKAPPIFHKAEKLHINYKGSTVNGFRWIPLNANGKKILIIHGFSSYSYKFEKYVSLLKKQGFEVMAFDAPAHGVSEGKYINALDYSEVLLKIEANYGPFYGFMGHSLGGLAASLAFTKLPNQQDRKLVLIAPATETTRAIEHFFSIVVVEDKVKTAFLELISEKIQIPLSQISVSYSVKQIQSPILWVHDKDDSICVFDAVKPVMDEKIANIEFLITEGLGHSRVYKEIQVSNAVVQFFNSSLN